MIRRCRDCEVSFEVDLAEQQWCRSQGVGLPRRCLGCRAERRRITDQAVECARCGTPFTYSREMAVLVATFSWTPPTRCIAGCDPKARKNLRGERKKMAELHDRMLAAPDQEAAKQASPVKPGALFKGLDAMLEKAAAKEKARAEEEAQAAPDPEEPASGSPLAPSPRGGEDLPSPDDLFRGLGDKSRKTSHD